MIFRLGSIHIGQNHFEGVGGHFDPELCGTITVEGVDAADAGAIGFNQPQAVENGGQIFVPGLGDARPNVLGGQAGRQAADGNELRLRIVYVDDDAAAVPVIPMHNGVEQRFLRVVRAFDALQALEHRRGFVAEHQIMEGILQLCENGAGQFLLILEGGLGIIAEYGDLDAVRALIRYKQRQIGKQIAVRLRDAQGAILLFSKFHTVLFERGGSGNKGQVLIHGAHLFKYVPIAVLDHPADFLRRRRHAGCTLAHIYPAGLQPFALQTAGLVGAFTHRDAHHFAVLNGVL